MAYGAGTGAGITGNTEFDKFIPEIWSSAVEGFLRRKLQFKDMITDYSSFLSSGGDRVHVPTLSEVGVGSKTENTVIQYDATTESDVVLVVDQHKYASKMFEDISLIQSSGELVSQYASIMGYALAKKIDLDIAAALADGSAGLNLSAVTTGDDDTLTNANIEAILATLGEADVDYRDGNVNMVVNPTMYADLLNNDRFIRADALGRENISSGQLGSIFGLNVFMSNALGTAGTEVAGLVFDKSACGIAIQKDIGVENQRDIDYLADKVVFSCLYGIKMIHRGRGLRIVNDN